MTSNEQSSPFGSDIPQPGSLSLSHGHDQACDQRLSDGEQSLRSLEEQPSIRWVHVVHGEFARIHSAPPHRGNTFRRGLLGRERAGEHQGVGAQVREFTGVEEMGHEAQEPRLVVPVEQVETRPDAPRAPDERGGHLVGVTDAAVEPFRPKRLTECATSDINLVEAELTEAGGDT